MHIFYYTQDQLENLKISLQKEMSWAFEEMRAAKIQLNAIKRIKRLIKQAPDSDSAFFEVLLKEYPDIDEVLIKKREMRQRARAASEAFAETTFILSGPVRGQQEGSTFRNQLTHKYGDVVIKELWPWIPGEVAIQIDRRLHIFWGGRGQPLGPGHGHCVFSPKELVYRRDPVA